MDIIYIVSHTPTEHEYAVIDVDAEGGYHAYHSQKRARLFHPDGELRAVTATEFGALLAASKS